MPGAEALMRMRPPRIEMASVPPLCGSGLVVRVVLHALPPGPGVMVYKEELASSLTVAMTKPAWGSAVTPSVLPSMSHCATG